MKKFGIRLLSCLCILLVALWFLVATQAGLRACISLTKTILHHNLTIERTQGRLWHAFTLENMVYRAPQGMVKIQRLELDWKPWRLLKGQFAIKQLLLSQLNIQSLASSSLDISELSFNGVVGYTASSPLKFALNWQDLQLGLNPQTKIYKAHGSLHAQGVLADYSWQLLGNFPGQGLPSSEWHITGQGQTQKLTATQLQLKTLGGEILGQAALNWKTGINWQIALKARDLNPGIQWPQLAGKLSFQLANQGVTTPELNTSTQLTELKGALHGAPLSGGGQFTMQGQTLQIPDFSFKAGSAYLRLAGSITDHWNVSWQLNIPTLDQLIADSQGSLQSTGKLTGLLSQPKIDTRLRLQGLNLGQYSIKSLQGDGYINLDPAQTSQFYVNAADLKIASTSINQARLQLHGANGQQQLQATIHTPQEHYLLALTGARLNDGWQISLPTLNMQSARFGNWQLTRVVSAKLTADHALLQPFCWQAKLQKICLQQAYWRQNKDYALQMQGQNLELGLLQAWLPSSLSINGHADMKIKSISTAHHNKTEASLNIGVAHIHVIPPNNSPNAALQQAAKTVIVHDLNLLGQINEQTGLQGELQARLLDQPLSLTIQLPAYKRLAPPDLAQPVNAKLAFTLNDLGLVSAAVPDLANVNGKLQLEVQAMGSLAKPQLTGKALLQNAEFSMPAYGTHIQHLQGSANSYTDGKIDYQLSALAGPDSQLTLSGTAQLLGKEPSSKSLLVGKNVLLVNTDEYRVVADPTIELSTYGTQMRLAGTLVIPQAKIRPRDFSQGVIELPEDLIVIGKQPVIQDKALPLNIELKLKLGKQVQVDAKGLTARLEGDIVLFNQPQHPTTASGQLNILEGSYKVYGETLSIRTGQLIYAGGAIANPGLNIRAVRQIKTGLLDTVQVGVNVQGQLKQPKVNLFSEPANLSQADILSYLLTGAPTSQISSAKSQLILKAASALKPGGTSQIDNIKKGLQQQLGLDELDVGTLQQYSTEKSAIVQNTSLMLGKQLTPKLHVGYSMGITERINTLTLRYQLWRKLLLQTETTGDNSGLDLIYTIERK
jgi:translocation and assembly module TamB